MKNPYILLGIVLLMCLLLMCCSKTGSIDDVKEPPPDLTISTIPTSEPYTESHTEPHTEPHTISKDEVLLLTIEIDSLNIPEEELRVQIKPRADYCISPDGNVYVIHESLLPNIDDKILCGVEYSPGSIILKKSCENTLVIKTGYLLIDNEVVFQKVPSIEYITVKSLGNGVAEVKYNNMKRLIHPEETLYDVVPFEINNKKYTIRLTIRNFGLVRKDSIKKG